MEIYVLDNLVDYIDVCVEGGVFEVGFKLLRNNFLINGKYKKEVRVFVLVVNSLKVFSFGDIIIKNGLKMSGKVIVKVSSSGDVIGSIIFCDDFVVIVNSLGDVILEKVFCMNFFVDVSSLGDVFVKNLNVVDVFVDVSFFGDVILVGICENVFYRVSSSGDVKVKGMKVVNVIVSVSFFGDVECYVIGLLIVKVFSSGEVVYKGNFKDIDFFFKRGLCKME